MTVDRLVRIEAILYFSTRTLGETAMTKFKTRSALKCITASESRAKKRMNRNNTGNGLFIIQKRKLRMLIQVDDARERS